MNILLDVFIRRLDTEEKKTENMNNLAIEAIQMETQREKQVIKC